MKKKEIIETISKRGGGEIYLGVGFNYLMPGQTRNKLSQTVTKIVNKGSNNLIAFVF